MTTIYLGVRGNHTIDSLATYGQAAEKPSALASFHYRGDVRHCKKVLRPLGFRMMLDSGAFSAAMKKVGVDREALMAEIRSGDWTEAAVLDVIGDPVRSLENARAFRAAGVKAIPTFHFGEPWEYLREYCREYDKVGLGGLVPVKSPKDKIRWLGEVFSREWPRRFHAFGYLSEDGMMRFPFHSADSSSWQGAWRFGGYSFAGGQKLGIGHSAARKATDGRYMRVEVDEFMRLERRIKARWAGEFRKQGWA